MPTCVISISSKLFYIVFFILIITQSYSHSLPTRSTLTLAARLALTLTASTRILKLITIPTAIATTTPSTAINQSSELCFRYVYHIITSMITHTHTHTHTHSTLALTPTAYTRMLTLATISAAITKTTTTTTTTANTTAKPFSELCFPCA